MEARGLIVRLELDGEIDEEALAAATESARRAAVLELYRLGRITSGFGAKLLRIDRADFLDLAAAHGVPTIQLTPDELRNELLTPHT